MSYHSSIKLVYCFLLGFSKNLDIVIVIFLQDSHEIRKAYVFFPG